VSGSWSRDEDPFVSELREVVLERLRVEHSQAVARSLIESARIEQRPRMLYQIADALIIAMSAHVLADRLAPEIIRERKVFRWNVPASGWQQWKANHGAKLPAWFLRRWPVRFVEHVHTGEVAVRLDRFWTFPESTVRMPELGQPVRLMQWSPSVEWIEGDRS
jgi:hypothetical protein